MILGPCDRRASHIKSTIRRYINEGHDVTTASQMKQVSFRGSAMSFYYKLHL